MTVDVNFDRTLLFYSLILAPLIYLLTKQRMYNILTKKEVVHFSPFVIALVYFGLIGLFDWGYAPKLSNWFGIVQISYLILYTALSFVLIVNCNKGLNTLTPKVFIYKVIGLYYALFIVFFGLNMDHWITDLGQTVLAYSLASIYVFAGLAIIITDLILVFYKKIYTSKKESVLENNEAKYVNSGLSKELMVQLVDKLNSLMIEEKPFLDNNLNLEDLAKKLSITRYHLSQTINQYYEFGFYDYINKFRIDEAKELIRQDRYCGVTDIGYQAGFNNRVSFYKAFKKFEGCTPTQYRKNQKKVPELYNCNH